MTGHDQLAHLFADEHGTFHGGYTSEDVDSVLGALSDATGLRLVAVWDYVDEWGTGGNTNIGVERDGRVVELAEQVCYVA